jgi:hypothetical protein
MTDEARKPRPPLYLLLQAPPEALGISGFDKCVLVSYVEELRPEENGTLVWPSQETVALRWGASVRHVGRAVRHLCKLNYMKLHRRTGHGNEYTINVDLIRRTIETGPTVRSLKLDRTPCPTRPDTMSGQSGHHVRSGRTPCPPNNPLGAQDMPNKPPISHLGASAPSKVSRKAVQQQLAVLKLVADAADRMRTTDGEAPNKEKRNDIADLSAGIFIDPSTDLPIDFGDEPVTKRANGASDPSGTAYTVDDRALLSLDDRVRAAMAVNRGSAAANREAARQAVGLRVVANFTVPVDWASQNGVGVLH